MENTLTKDEVFTSLPVENKTAATSGEPQLRFREAIDLIEGRAADFGRYRAVKATIERHIAEGTDLEQIAIGYFYLIRVYLLESAFRETTKLRELYAKMHTNFLEAEAKYKKELSQANDGERDLISRQLEAFYQLTDGYLKSLELIYDERGFQRAKDRIHADRMRFRRRAASHAGNHIVHLGHLFMEHTSNYGHSFVRWGITLSLFVLVFASIYWTLDHSITGGVIHGEHNQKGFFDYLYFSVVVLTTIGFGDLVPVGIARFFAGMEGVLGYIMLGIFLTLIQKRL